MFKMINRMVNNNAADERRSCLSNFFDGYFLPYNVQVTLMSQEPSLGDTTTDGDYIHSIWQDVGDIMKVAINEYASNES